MPEVLGDAARLVDPLDVGALAEAIRDVLLDADRRQALRAAGLERAREYCWDASARRLLEVYAELARSAA
jgi:alpha-1,3-rhamnosyl/mannosyltransferase